VGKNQDHPRVKTVIICLNQTRGGGENQENSRRKDCLPKKTKHSWTGTATKKGGTREMGSSKNEKMEGNKVVNQRDKLS